MTGPPGWTEALLLQLAASAPARVLVVAPAGHAVHGTLRARLPDAAIDPAHDPGRLPGSRYDLAVVAGTLESLTADAARALLAALRDRVAAHTVAWLDAARAPLGEDELRALGFRVLARDGAQLLCGFDLQEYKDRPDWLDARHWAHPELWDRFRW